MRHAKKQESTKAYRRGNFKKKQSVETFHEGIRIVGLLEKDIKSAGINSIKELKETISK